MGWNPSSHRMTPPVDQISDLADAFGVNSDDLGVIIRTGTIQKWAKWKPVRSTLDNLTIEDDWRMAGRTTPQDYSRQFGVLATGVGNVTNLSGIHNCKFVYEQPVAGYGYKYRILDTIHPNNSPSNNYGYRSDAHCDLYGNVPPTSGNNIVLPYDEIGLPIDITYTPFSAAEAEEMISIKDFLTNEAGAGTTYDPLNCYPCVLITQGSYHYIRGLYKLGSTSISTIGTSGHETWYLDMRNAPTGSEAWNVNLPAKLSVFLCSSATIHTTVPVQNISNWVVIPVSQSGSSAWDAWFCPVPDATDYDVYFQVPPAVSVTLPEPGSSVPGLPVPYIISGTLRVTLQVTSNISTTLYVQAELIPESSGDDPTKSVILRGNESSETRWIDFSLTDDFATPFITGDYTFRITAYIISSGVVNVLTSKTYTVHYS